MEQCLISNNTFYCILIVHPIALVAALSAAIAVYGVILQRRNSREKNAIDFEKYYKEDKAIQKAYETYRSFKQSEEDITQWAAADALEHQSTREIRLLLNTWERASNAMMHGVYDEDYLYQAHCMNLINLYEYCHPYIRIKQKRGNPRQYLNLQVIAIKWIQRRRKEDRIHADQALSSAQMKIDKYFGEVSQTNKSIALKRASEELHRIINRIYK